MKKPTLRFRNISPAELRKYAEQIFDKMTEASEIFPTPVPSMESFSKMIQTFSACISEAAFRDHRAIVQREQKMTELKQMMRKLAKYVDSIADGDEILILAAGFIPSRDADRSTSPTPKAFNLTATPLGLGTSKIRLRVNPWSKAKLYQFEYRKNAINDRWTTILCLKSSCLLDDLESFQCYEFRVTYVGKDLIPHYSDIISTFAL